VRTYHWKFGIGQLIREGCAAIAWSIDVINNDDDKLLQSYRRNTAAICCNGVAKAAGPEGKSRTSSLRNGKIDGAQPSQARNRHGTVRELIVSQIGPWTVLFFEWNRHCFTYEKQQQHTAHVKRGGVWGEYVQVPTKTRQLSSLYIALPFLPFPVFFFLSAWVTWTTRSSGKALV